VIFFSINKFSGGHGKKEEKTQGKNQEDGQKLDRVVVKEKVVKLRWVYLVVDGRVERKEGEVRDSLSCSWTNNF
jgi:hypothetical protein